MHGWQVEDCTVTMTHTGYYPRQSHAHQSFNKNFSSVAADFRNLAPVVLMAALREAGTQVCEPIDRFDLEIPTDTVGAVLATVLRANGLLHSTEQRAAGYTRVTGTIPLTHRRDVAGRLPDLTRGEGVLTAEPGGHAPVHGAPPRRTRRGPDPLRRADWFRANPR
jgi:ribosomal protection tetracycline resistance protein